MAGIGPLGGGSANPQRVRQLVGGNTGKINVGGTAFHMPPPIPTTGGGTRSTSPARVGLDTSDKNSKPFSQGRSVAAAGKAPPTGRSTTFSKKRGFQNLGVNQVMAKATQRWNPSMGTGTPPSLTGSSTDINTEARAVVRGLLSGAAEKPIGWTTPKTGHLNLTRRVQGNTTTSPYEKVRAFSNVLSDNRVVHRRLDEALKRAAKQAGAMTPLLQAQLAQIMKRKLAGSVYQQAGPAPGGAPPEGMRTVGGIGAMWPRGS